MRVRIGEYTLDTVAHELRDDQGPIGLEPRAFELLVYLFEHRDRAVPKDELLESLWSGRHVTEGVLTQAVTKIRRVLGGDTQRYIKTVHRVGYRFIGSFDALPDDDVQVVPVTTVYLATARSDPAEDRDVEVQGFDSAADALRVAVERQGKDALARHGMSAVESNASDAQRERTVAAAAAMAKVARPRQILLTASAFDFARVAAEEDDGKQLSWIAHGAFRFDALNETLLLFEIGEPELAPLQMPVADAGVTPVAAEELVLGWRAAPGQTIPDRPQWRLVEALGEGGYGEAWLARHDKTNEARVFKFCYDAAKVRSLQREVTLFRLLREALGRRADIARILEWNFDQPPYYIESEYSSDGDLVQWASQQGGLRNVPLKQRLNLVAQVATALSAAHQAGVLHKDVKPRNVLIRRTNDGEPQAVLSDFGIGLLTDIAPLREHDITELGVTDALVGNLTTARSGTRRYAAPEQLEGKDATARSDVYALGVLLYQMVTGDFDRVVAAGWERGIDNPVLREDLRALLDRDPDRRPDDPAQVAAGLASLDKRTQALRREKERAQRRQRLRLAALATVVVGAVSAAAFWPRDPVVLPASPDLSQHIDRSVAVWFAARPDGGVTVGEALSRGILESLAGTPGLRVIDPGAVAAATDGGPLDATVGARLDADYLLFVEGPAAANTTSVRARLMPTATDDVYWESTFSTPSGDALTLQRQLVEAVRTALLAAPTQASGYASIDEDAVLGKLAIDQRQWQEAYARLKGANPSDPRDSRTKSLAELLTILGYLERAETLYTEALASTRTDVQVMNQKAAHLYELLGNQVAMLERAESAAEAGSGRAGFYFATDALRRGDIDTAIPRQLDALNRLGNRADWVAPVYRAVVDPSKKSEALALLANADPELLLQEKQFFLQYGLLGETDLAIRALERGLNQPEFILTFAWLPEMDHVRGDPRFIDLMARYGIVDFWRVEGPPDLCRRASTGFRCR